MTDQTLGGAVPLKKIFLYAALGIFVVTTMVLGVFAFMGWQFVNTQETEVFANEKAKRFVSEVVQDLAAVRAEPFFQAIVKAEALEASALNAGMQLNRMLSWNIPEESTGSPPVAGGLDLPVELTDRLGEWSEEWLEHAQDVDPATIDFAWMKELQQFRFWTLDLDSPLGDALARNPELDPLRFPSPEYRVLTAWVKLRLLAGMRTGEPKVALDEVRHLGFLLMTAQDLVAELVGIKYLRLANQVALKSDLPMVVDGDTLDKARRVFWGLQAYLDFTVPEELYRQVYPENAIHPGACAASEERLSFAAFTRETLAPSYPDEFRRFEGRLDELQKGCRRGLKRKHYDMKLTPLVLSGRFFETMTMADPAPMVGDGSEWQTIKRFGFLRKALGLVMANLGKPDGLSPYEGEEPVADEG